MNANIIGPGTNWGLASAFKHSLNWYRSQGDATRYKAAREKEEKIYRDILKEGVSGGNIEEK
jgi:hypothetical protein